MLPSVLTFVDLETTGTSAVHDRVIEIAILRVEDGRLTDTFTSLVNPHCYVPPQIEAITGIQADELESAPSFREITDQVASLLTDAVFVAHNVRFDYSFLKNEFRRQHLDFKPRHFCTVKLSRALYPGHRHHDLSSLISRFGFSCPQRHRAGDDARILWEFYQLVQQQFPPEHVDQVISRLLKTPTRPIQVPAEVWNNLPEAPGVYIFYGADDVPLYVGKSVNIRQRVMSHFCSDYQDGKEMKISQQVTQIETIVTPGELGALLKESELVKKLQPLYNRLLRHARKLVTLQHFQTDQGYDSLRITQSEHIDIADLSSILGVFKSQKQAKDFLADLAKEHHLCEKLLGLEPTAGACFAHRLGRCKGACLGQEPVALYNARTQLAFSRTRIQPWPFEEAVAIPEHDQIQKQSVFHLINKWCYLGSVTVEGDCQNVTSNSQPDFDLDVYKILRRYLDSPKHQAKIKLIPASTLNRQILSGF